MVGHIPSAIYSRFYLSAQITGYGGSLITETEKRG